MKKYALMPCFKSSNIAPKVVKDCLKYVDKVICIDDCCPENTGKIIKKEISDPRVVVLFHSRNKGVGGATKTGIKYALSENAEIIIKIDSDGQMSPDLIPELIKPLLEKRAEFTKGNRFRSPDVLIKMPLIRLIGNLGLSFLTKLSTGYWELFDPTNGFIAFSRNTISRIPLMKIDNRYFFETDLLFRLSLSDTLIEEISMQPLYKNEKSSLVPLLELFNFFFKHLFIFFKRIFYQYFLLDFNPGSISLVISLILGSMSIIIGFSRIVIGNINKVETPYGIQTLFLTFILISSQFFINFIYYDASQRVLFRKLRIIR